MVSNIFCFCRILRGNDSIWLTTSFFQMGGSNTKLCEHIKHIAAWVGYYNKKPSAWDIAVHHSWWALGHCKKWHVWLEKELNRQNDNKQTTFKVMDGNTSMKCDTNKAQHRYNVYDMFCMIQCGTLLKTHMKNLTMISKSGNFKIFSFQMFLSLRVICQNHIYNILI